ncbi:hypothetical protein CUMW_121830 [Citrus unshiu]|nr:hypothetical protein CUMW_121830 [Citrus unshiu]
MLWRCPKAERRKRHFGSVPFSSPETASLPGKPESFFILCQPLRQRKLSLIANYLVDIFPPFFLAPMRTLGKLGGNVNNQKQAKQKQTNLSESCSPFLILCFSNIAK